MMKILAFVGTNADFSYNRLLLRFMKKHFKQMADIFCSKSIPNL